jgi:hypothetical protein
MKIAVISANIGGIDTPKQMPKQNIDFDYFYFNEGNLPVPMTGLDNRLKAKLFKMQAHKLFPNYDILIWMDSNIQVKTNDFIDTMVNALTLDFDIAISKHPSRNCIYEETQFIVDEIAKGNKYLSTRYNSEALINEAQHFRANSHRENAGLYWCGLFARRNNKKVNAFFDQWYMDNILWGNFDQTNFVFEAEKHDMKLSIINWGNFYKNENYELTNHLKIA